MRSFRKYRGAGAICAVILALGLRVRAGAVEFAGGTGTPADPYQIATPAQLVSLNSDPNLLSRCFALEADIDLDPNLPGGSVFEAAVVALGNTLAGPVSFTGSLDGRGHTIRNLTIVSTHPAVGLFERIEWPGRVQDLALVNAQIESTAAAGTSGPAGVRWGVGALAGENWGVVRDCCVTGSVTGVYQVAGLVGDNRGTVFCCYSAAVVHGAQDVGGLVGYNRNGVVAQCYACGPVQGPGGASTLGGLAGLNVGGVILHSYFLDPNDGGGPANGLGTALPAAALRQQDSFVGWDFWGTDDDGALNMWFISPGSFPCLAWQKERTSLTWVPGVQMCSLDAARARIEEAGLSAGRVSYESAEEIEVGRVVRVQPAHPVAPGTVVDVMVSSGPYDWGANPGKGNAASPYWIEDADQLQALSQKPELWSKHFLLTADIDLTGRVYTRAPIAPDTRQPENGNRVKADIDTPFTGRFDGHGHTIRGLTIVSADQYAGLFGMIGWGGRVQNLAVTRAYIVGRIRGGDDEPSQSETTVPRGRCGAGALAAENAGTLCGCMSNGLVVGTEEVGGLLGHNYGTVTACYSTASVAGTRIVGGLVGRNYTRLARSYAAGAVSGPDVGGLVGWVLRGALVQNCFWDVEASHCQSGCAGKGRSTVEMMDASLYSLWGWAGDPNWVISDGSDYPRLAWEGAPGAPIPAPAADWFEGSGTPDDPYRITAPEQIRLLGTASVLWDRCFILCADLDLAQQDHESIGVCQGTGFTGCFDGRGHVLSHLAVDGSLAPDYQGLFGCIDSQGRVLRLGLRQSLVAGRDYVGALAGLNAGTIDCCFADAAVTGNNWVGGLAGMNMGKILRCYSLASVTGYDDSGVLVGRHQDGLVAYCYAAGTAESTWWAGNAEGLIGSAVGANQAFNYYLQRSDENFWCIHPVTPLSDTQMRERASFAGWDFYGTDADGTGDHWFMPPGGYPVLSWQTDVTGLCAIPDVRHAGLETVRQSLTEAGFALGSITSDYDRSVPRGDAVMTVPHYYAPVGGTVALVQSLGSYDWSTNPGRGTEADPFLIQTPGQLECIRPPQGLPHFALANDISLSGRVYTSFVIPALLTSFDGRGHRIVHFEGIGTSLSDDIWSDVSFRNLTLEQAVVLGARGALAPANRGNITNCHIVGQVAGGGYGFGGLTGYNAGTLRGCSVRGIIRGMDSTWGLGGLVGDNGGIVEECRVARSEIWGGDATWGLGGLVGSNRAFVRDCYAEVLLVNPGSAWSPGGLVGENSGTVARSWASCRILSMCAMWDPGGLVADNTGVITSSYFNRSARYNDPGTVLTEAQMCRRDSFIGWDFAGQTADGTADVWTICEGKDYPRLWWEKISCE